MCEDLWAGAFSYDASNKGFEWSFRPGEPNPNDLIYNEVVPPEPCPGHNVTEADRDAACLQVSRIRFLTLRN